LSIITLGRSEDDFECGFDDRTLEGVAEDNHHGEHGQDYAAFQIDKGVKVTWPVYRGKIVVLAVINRNITNVSRQIIREVFSVMQRKIRCLRFKEIRRPPIGFRYLKINVQGECLTPEMKCHGTTWTELEYTKILMKQRACKGASKKCLINWHKVFQHEMFHAFGIAHIQTRSDRDKYIKVNYDNITPVKHRQYDKCMGCSLSKTPYDCQSIMHYPSHHNAINESKPTITPVDPSCKLSRDMRYKNATVQDWDSLREMLLLMHPKIKSCPRRVYQYYHFKNNKNSKYKKNSTNKNSKNYHFKNNKNSKNKKNSTNKNSKNKNFKNSKNSKNSKKRKNKKNSTNKNSKNRKNNNNSKNKKNSKNRKNIRTKWWPKVKNYN